MRRFFNNGFFEHRYDGRGPSRQIRFPGKCGYNLEFESRYSKPTEFGESNQLNESIYCQPVSDTSWVWDVSNLRFATYVGAKNLKHPECISCLSEAAERLHEFLNS